MKTKPIEWRREYLRILENGPRDRDTIKYKQDALIKEWDILKELKDNGLIKCEFANEYSYWFDSVTIDGHLFADRIREELAQKSVRYKITKATFSVLGFILGALATTAIGHYFPKGSEKAESMLKQQMQEIRQILEERQNKK